MAAAIVSSGLEGSKVVSRVPAFTFSALLVQAMLQADFGVDVNPLVDSLATTGPQPSKLDVASSRLVARSERKLSRIKHF
jgi:hypothetical protein